MRYRVVLVALLAGLALPSGASAVAYKVGPQTELFGGPCGPQAGNLAFYSQQTATGSSAGIEPKVGEVFYVGVTLSFTQYFSCAADFWSAVMTLPPGVVPAVGDPAADTGARPICIRRAFRGSQSFDDPRMGSSCPVVADFNGSTRELRFGPKPAPTFPDQPGFFFIGQRAPQESLLYTKDSVLIPVKATSTVNQDVTTLFCTVGTECRSGSTVRMNVDPAPAAGTVAIALGGDVQVGAESALLPLNITTTLTSYNVRVAIREGGTTAGPFACGASDYQYLAISGGGGAFEFRTGPDFQPPPPCYLKPSTTYLFEVCHNTSGTAVTGCKSTTFTTSAITTSFEPPEETAADRPDSTQMTFRSRKVLTSHAAGSFELRRKRIGQDDSAFTYSAAAGLPDADAGADVPGTFTWDGFTPWATYAVASCYKVGVTRYCGPSSTLVAGYVDAPADATDITSSGATVSGLPSAPWPAGTMSIRTSTTDPGAKDPRTAMTEAAAKAISASPGSATSFVLTGLAAGTTYWWVACFDADTEPGVEDCSAPRSFTTAAAPAGGTPTPTPGGSTSPTPSPTVTPDTTKPTAKIAVKRKGKKLRIKVTSADAGGIRSVTLRIGKGKAKAYTKPVKVKRRKGKLKLVATVTDRAGNITVVRKTVR